MYSFFSLLTGALIAVMIVCNGGLTATYGIPLAVVILHSVGLLSILLLLLVRRENPFAARLPWFLYLGGSIGVCTAYADNIVFGQISVSAMLALGLLGQSITGLLIDQFGLMGMAVCKFRREKIWGLLLVLAGIGCMLTNFKLLPLLLSFSSGVSLVLSRTVNSRLAAGTSPLVSTFFNFLLGLSTAVLLLLLCGQSIPPLAEFPRTTSAFFYFGGVLSVCVVLLSNLTVSKVSAFFMTLFLFVGQVFTGLALDVFLSGSFSLRNFFGGALVASGLCLNLWLDNRLAKRIIS